MADENSQQVDPARRRFLVAAKGAGALGAVAVLFGKGAAVKIEPPPQVAQAQPSPAGYHETEHIREYYRSARYW